MTGYPDGEGPDRCVCGAVLVWQEGRFTFVCARLHRTISRAAKLTLDQLRP